MESAWKINFEVAGKQTRDEQDGIISTILYETISYRLLKVHVVTERLEERKKRLR